MRLRIRYRSGIDELSEREISDIHLESNDSITAFCHLRNEYRTFVLSRIENTTDLISDNPIEDIWLFLGLASLKQPPKTFPTFTETFNSLTTEEAHKRRSEDKAALYRAFRLPSLVELQKKKLRALFDDCCFNCRSSLNLVHDHHIPQCLGGRLVPGNIVLLCAVCNSIKLDRHPKDFYSQTQLRRLQMLLEQQVQMFDFTFNHVKWANHPREYLLELGLSDADIASELDGARVRIGLTLSMSTEKSVSE